MQYVTCEHEEKVKVQVMHRKYEFIVFVEHLELRLYYPQKSVIPWHLSNIFCKNIQNNDDPIWRI